MKRQEEIVTQAVKEQSQLHQPLEWGAGFISGAKWADKTMLDRACEWLKENIDLYSYNAFNKKSGYPEMTLTEVFETAFRQAMEGGAE
jgi:hypothetical protein